MKLIVVTDIFSLPAPVDCISTMLPAALDITRISLNDLCGRPDLSGERLHQHLFSQSGIEKAAFALREISSSKGCFGLGYSAGGTALWRAAAKGMSLKGVYCVSSARLREEVSIPIPTHVFFGARDQNKPSARWLSKIPDRHSIFPDVGHTYYLEAGSEETKATYLEIASDMARHSFPTTPTT